MSEEATCDDADYKHKFYGTPETIALKLTERQREAMAKAWFDKGRGVHIPVGRPSTNQKLGALGLTAWDHGIGSYLTPLGIQVRDYLEKGL